MEHVSVGKGFVNIVTRNSTDFSVLVLMVGLMGEFQVCEYGRICSCGVRRLECHQRKHNFIPTHLNMIPW